MPYKKNIPIKGRDQMITIKLLYEMDESCYLAAHCNNNSHGNIIKAKIDTNKKAKFFARKCNDCNNEVYFPIEYNSLILKDRCCACYSKNVVSYYCDIMKILYDIDELGIIM